MTHPADLLSAEFDLLADDPQAPVSTVDFDRALADGRRTVRIRRRRAGLSGVGALALAALIAASLLTAGKATAPPGTGGLGTDPLHAYAEFGWLPAKLTGTMYSQDPASHHSSTVAYDPRTIDLGGTHTTARLDVWTEVGSGPLTGSISGSGTQVGTRNGYPVVMDVVPLSAGMSETFEGIGMTVNPCGVVSPNPPSPSLQGTSGSHGEASIFWRTADGGAAQITYLYVSRPAPDAATMLHMAESVTFHAVPVPVPLPLRISGLSGVPVAFVQNGYLLGQPAFLALEFLEDGVLLQIDVNVPADGHSLCGTPPPEWIASRVINGLKVTVQITGSQNIATADRGRFGTAAQILDRITSLGPVPADWTTHVIEP